MSTGGQSTHGVRIDGNSEYFCGKYRIGCDAVDGNQNVFKSVFNPENTGGLEGAPVTEASIKSALKDSSLRTLQERISLPVVERFVRLLEKGSVPPAIKVAKGVIIDGNHRYAAAKILGIDLKQIPSVLRENATIRSVQDFFIDLVDYGNR
jgi:hypothetical protein